MSFDVNKLMASPVLLEMSIELELLAKDVKNGYPSNMNTIVLLDSILTQSPPNNIRDQFKYKLLAGFLYQALSSLQVTAEITQLVGRLANRKHLTKDQRNSFHKTFLPISKSLNSYYIGPR